MSRWPAEKSLSDLTLVLESRGSACTMGLTRVNNAEQYLAKVVPKPCYSKSEYNSSRVASFVASMREPHWEDINFVASHGGFIRRLAQYLQAGSKSSASHGGVIRRLVHYLQAGGETRDDLTVELNSAKRNNLFVLRIQQYGKVFYMIRHCARQFQNAGLFGGERTTPDPKCARNDRMQICGEEDFKQRVRLIVARETAEEGDRSKRVGVYASCMRRAVETAHVVREALLDEDKVRYSALQVQIVPFCREGQNLLGLLGGDLLNTCSSSSMASIMKTQSGQCQRELRATSESRA